MQVEVGSLRKTTGPPCRGSSVHRGWEELGVARDGTQAKICPQIICYKRGVSFIFGYVRIFLNCRTHLILDHKV